MQRLIVLHTNDIHGRSAGLARVITLVERIRAENPDAHVLYFDLGDVEDTSNRLSNLTKGVAMYRLLALAQPDAAAVGNGSVLRYGWQVLAEHAAALDCPLLMANLQLSAGETIPGAQAATVLHIGDLKLGLIGLTATFSAYARFFGLHTPDTARTVRRQFAALQDDGADAVLVLSHMGLSADREIAEKMQGRLTAILGAHSHDLLPEGEWVGDVLVAQAGDYAQHLGRIEFAWDGTTLTVETVSMMPVPEDIPPAPQLAAEEAAIEQEVETFLDTIIGHLDAPLDWAEDRRCGVGDILALALKERMKAEVGVVVAGAAFKGPLPGGALSRRALWEVCDSSGNPGLVEMTGAQLATMIANGLDPERAAERPRSLRGRARGLLHLAGAAYRDGEATVGGEPLDSERVYRVAGSDFELEHNFGYTLAAWELDARYEVPTIMREVLADYLGGD